MYLSDRDIRWAIETGALVLPADAKVDPSSVDLRLDNVDQAKVWDIESYKEDLAASGNSEPHLHLGSFRSVDFSEKYLIQPPVAPVDETEKVYRNGNQILVRPGGFLLWQTKEKVGTPEVNPSLICFVDGKSTRARTGFLVHFTAPTIHAGWSGQVVLEITNLGPVVFVLKEDDVIAQLTIARISGVPEKTHRQVGSSTMGQTTVAGKKI